MTKDELDQLEAEANTMHYVTLRIDGKDRDRTGAYRELIKLAQESLMLKHNWVIAVPLTPFPDEEPFTGDLLEILARRNIEVLKHGDKHALVTATRGDIMDLLAGHGLIAERQIKVSIS